MKVLRYLYYLPLLFTLACTADDDTNAPAPEEEFSTDPLDVYIHENFTEPYGVAVRYRYVDRYVDPNNRVTPPRQEVVQSTLDFLTEYWIQPYLEIANGEEYLKSTIPAEVILIGSLIYASDGLVVLGTADAGARITLTDVNSIDLENQEWLFRQLGTIYHEYAHIMHQLFDLPPGFEEISPQGYTSRGSWFTLNDTEALQRGFVSPYGTSDVNEDFAEVVAFLLYEPSFFEEYIEEEACNDEDCEERNEGRAMLRAKYNAIVDHYQRNVGVDLLQLRARIQERL